ncbi:MAG: nitroreductase [Gammaproteobacteria bacterium]|nr:MAG: nitroreductase [Gammaproteobacteria bacterium]
MNEVIKNILTRRSCAKLIAPAPTADELKQVLRCALNAPDHGRLRPWRYVILQGQALDALGQAFANIKEAESGGLTEQQRTKFLNMPSRAPLIIVAIADIKEHSKVPPIEQALTVGCAVQNMHLALKSLGYGAMWRTGDLAFNNAVKQYFNAQDSDQIVGFLYVGTPESAPKEIEEQPLDQVVEFWS